MANVRVLAGIEGGYINNVSGLYRADNGDDQYISSTSSSADANENEAHIWFDTTDANTGLAPADTILSVSLTVYVNTYNNSGDNLWVSYWGNGAGATFDLADWRVDASNSVQFDPLTTGFFTHTLGGTSLRDANFHVRIKCQSGGLFIPPSGNIYFSYTKRPYLTINYTPSVIVGISPTQLLMGK